MNNEKKYKLKKKWMILNKMASTVLKIAASGFVVTFLSPFDFEWPVTEIVTAVITLIGFVMKKISEYKLVKLENNELIDDNDKVTLLNISKNVGEAVSQKNSSKNN